MPVDFFSAACKSESSLAEFGICDDPPPPNTPAYVDEDTSNKQKWIAKVNNSSLKPIEFFAIDNCVELSKPEGGAQRRCDGLLRFDNTLIFVELKSGTHGWLGKGRKQLTETIERFRAEVTGSFTEVKAYVCNNMRPRAAESHKIEMARFKNDTGLILRIKQEISIP